MRRIENDPAGGKGNPVRCGNLGGDVRLHVDGGCAGLVVQLEFFFRARDDIVRAGNVCVNGAGKDFKQPLRPGAIGRDHILATCDPGGHDPVARGEMGCEAARDSEADDARSAALDRGAQRRPQPRPLIAKHRHARTARYASFKC